MPTSTSYLRQEVDLAIMDPLFTTLSEYAEASGFSLSREQLFLFQTYLRELKAWNERFNLTAIKDDRDILIKHFIDSMTPIGLIRPGSALLDIGSGAGFPGIPLKVMEPSLKVTLLDSVNKKVTFMRHVIAELGLADIEAVHSRAEELAKTRRGGFDVVISRALTNLADFIKLGEPFLKPDGILIAMKGSKADEEVKEAAKVMEKKKMRVRSLERLSLPSGAGERRIVILERMVRGE